ncbi:hypothetical protein FNH22_16745 [Fulvivirga sp. M361]|uniref:tetratricopeptide repeat protein n=1 Tax=Fulvivirga sp. M361 TaxID=2594266 RepID=UPI001179C472|nr:hypothetical protein [Fulvivirga sp. M361]TRX56287.1 hypothetical protein FNH22_16745 [Fulvivirga sp. M361]
MQSKLFWMQWTHPFKGLYSALFLLFFAALIWLAVSFFSAYDIYLDWNIQGQAETTETTIETVKIGPFNITSTAENTAYTQRYTSSPPNINSLSYNVFLIITVLCASVLITVISTLPRFSFYIGAGFIVLFFMNLKLELLYLFNSEEKIGMIIALVLFLPTVFYFNRIKSTIAFFPRFLVFLGLFLVLALIIYFSSRVDNPFFYIAAAGILNPLIISLVFVLMVGHEIIAGFIYILTHSNSPSSKHTLTHFSVITTIYLINIVLVYLHETRVIDWDIFYINPYLLLAVSAILGLWGYANRESQYGYLFRFSPVGGVFYITMGIICFTTLSHFMTTGNDPALEIFRDFTIYGHLGYGLIFVLYIISNFITPLKNNLKVYKVLYSPNSMPYFTFRLAGLIALIALLLKSNWEVPVNQGISAYYNGFGDLHIESSEPLLATSYYEEGAIYGYNNHKSNFALACLYTSQKEQIKAELYYENALKKWPSPNAYINLSNLYLDDNRFFEALFVLKDGLKTFPDNGPIHNNAGLLYGKTNILDSAIIHLDKAYQSNSSKNTAASNILALVSKSDLGIKADSVLQAYSIQNDRIALNNNYVLFNKSRTALKQNYEVSDSVLDFLDATILYNQAFNRLFDEDSLHARALINLVNKSVNVNVREPLKFAACLNLYKDHNVNEAFRELNWLANSSIANSGQYFNQIGIWALEQEAPEVAKEYFSWAANKEWEEARFNLAIALSEGGQKTEAIEAWKSIENSADVEAQQIAGTMLAILEGKTNDVSKLPDYQKYLITRYTLDLDDTLQFIELVKDIKDHNYKAQAYLDICKDFWNQGYEAKATAIYGKIAGLKITDEHLFNEIQWFELRMLAGQKNVSALARKINQGMVFDASHLLEKHFYTGLLNEASGDTLNARKNYELIAYMNPFFTEGVIHTAEYIGLTDPFEAYNILLSALEVNPSSVKLLKAYILQCARIQSESYAEISLKDLQQLIQEDVYDRFIKQYNELVEKTTKDLESF